MKIKKIIAAAASLALCLQIIPMQVYAEEVAVTAAESISATTALSDEELLKQIDEMTENYDFSKGGFAEIELSPEQTEALVRAIDEQKTKDGVTVNETSRDAIYFHYNDYFRAQLNTAEKGLYDSLVQICSNFMASSLDITNNYPDYVVYDPYIISEDRAKQIAHQVTYAHPEFFFNSGCVFGNYQTKKLIAPMVREDFKKYLTRRDAYNKITSRTSTWMSSINKISNDLDKEKFIAESLCKTVTYTSDKSVFSIYDTLVEQKGYSLSYATAMTYFCNAAGIDCITVFGENRSWNKVKIAGYWYNVDVSLMDRSTGIDYEWFNISNDTMKKLDTTYSQNHTPFAVRYYNLTLPSCTKDSAAAAVKPALPTGLTLTAGNGSITATWNAVKGADSYTVYTVLNDKYTLAGTTASTKFNITGLKNGTKYGVLVLATNSAGSSSYTPYDVKYATPNALVKPALPTGLTLTAGDGSITASWNAVKDASSYTVYTFLNDKYTKVGTTTSTKFTITGLKNGTKYGVLVLSTNSAGNSSYTKYDVKFATPFAKPALPTGLTLTAGNGSINATWNAVKGASSYTVYTFLNDKYTKVGTTTSTTFTITGLTNGTKYGVLVLATNAAGSSSYTKYDVKFATPFAKPALPTGLTLTAGNGSVTATWNAVKGASSYTVYTFLNDKYTKVGTTTSTTFTITGLTNGTRYGVLVLATNSSGSSAYTKYDVKFATPIAPVKPALPTGLTLTPGNGYISASWNAVSGARYYTVYTYSDGKYTKVGTPVSTKFNITGLTNGKKYGVLVLATNSSGNSAFTKYDVKFATPNVKPALPTGLTLTPGNGYITAGWNAVSGASYYTVYTYSDGKYTKVGTPVSTKFNITGLTNGKKYGVLVLATNSSGSSAFTKYDVKFATPNAESAPSYRMDTYQR